MSDPDNATASIDEPDFGRWVLGFWKPTATWERLALALAWVLSMFVFWHGSRLFSVPPLSQFDGSLFCNPSPVVGVLVTAVLLIVCTLLGTVLAGAVEFEAGFFGATLGMVVVSLRSGTMRSVIFETGGVSSVYYKLAGEILVLGVILAAAWLMLVAISQLSHGKAIAAAFKIPASDESSSLKNCLSALATQIIATGILIELLAVNESKNQVIGAVFVGSIVGGIAAHSSFPTRQTWCYWAGPLVVGFIGYALAAIGFVNGIENGNLQGTFAALARPLPLDYASVGPAGALIGYWMARGWSTEE